MKFSFKINFSWKSQEKIYRVFYFVNVGLKRRFELKFKFSSLSSTLILNAKHVLKVALNTFIFRNSEIQKILQESCHILSQYGATKTLRPFVPRTMGLTYDFKYWFKELGDGKFIKFLINSEQLFAVDISAVHQSTLQQQWFLGSTCLVSVLCLGSCHLLAPLTPIHQKALGFSRYFFLLR